MSGRKEPCHGCGTMREVRAIRNGVQCVVCVRLKHNEMIELKEDARVDWNSVDEVIQRPLDRPVRLNSFEKKLVVRNLQHRLIGADENTTDIPPGRLTSNQLARRMGCHPSAVQHIARRLPPATKQVCPECLGDMWVLEDGVVEEHGDGYHNRCPMSEEPFGVVEVPISTEVRLLNLPIKLLHMQIRWLVAS